MTGKNPLHYWDTCIFIAWLKNERRPAGEMEGLILLVTKVERNEVRLITSALTKTEVLECTLPEGTIKKLEDVLRRKNSETKMADDRIFTLASELRNYYQIQKDIDGLPTLTTPDAIHLATAIHFGADIFYTFDENNKTIESNRPRRALIPLSGQVAGKYNLVIKKPMGEPALLFKPHNEEEKK